MPILTDAFLIHYKCQDKQPLVTKDEGKMRRGEAVNIKLQFSFSICF